MGFNERTKRGEREEDHYLEMKTKRTHTHSKLALRIFESNKTI